jgi:predicted hydrocarbon binding protein
MKGIVMNLLAEMVESQLGMEEWNNVLEAAGLDGVYTSSVLYEDTELLGLVAIISDRNGIPIDDLVFAFGKFMLPSFIARYPYLLEGVDGFLAFLQSIDSVIHVEVKKLHPDATTPVFHHIRLGENELQLQYHSERRLCRMAEGLVAGAAEHYNAHYSLTHEPCMHRGGDHCGFLVKVEPSAQNSAHSTTGAIDE